MILKSILYVLAVLGIAIMFGLALIATTLADWLMDHLPWRKK